MLLDVYYVCMGTGRHPLMPWNVAAYLDSFDE